MRPHEARSFDAPPVALERVSRWHGEPRGPACIGAYGAARGEVRGRVRFLRVVVRIPKETESMLQNMDGRFNRAAPRDGSSRSSGSKREGNRR